MARRALPQGEPDRLLMGAVFVLIVLSFLPFGWLKPNAWLGDLISRVSAPVSHPLRIAGSWLAPARIEAEPETIIQLRRQVEEYRTLYERTRARNDDLLRQMEQMRVIVELDASVSTRLLYAPVIGAGSDSASEQLLIRAGTNQGVRPENVVAVDGVQLFGSVVETAASTSWIRPITSESVGFIRGAIMVADGQGVGCSLEPTGEGTLRGDVAYDPSNPDAADRIALGQIVRISDPEWPDAAQMLVLGTIESIEPAPDSPLRPVVVVRPTLALSRVTEVIVRVTETEGGRP